MDYSNKILQRDYLEKMDNIYSKQTVNSNQYRLLRSLLLANPVIELYDFPELFSSETEYELFFSDRKEETIEENNQDKIQQLLYMMLFSQAGAYPLRSKVTPRFEENLLYNQMRQDLAEHQAKVYTDFLENQKQSWTNTYSQEYNQENIQQELRKQQTKLKNLVEHQLRQRDNGLRYASELSASGDRNKYKHWIWNPNPHTRHTRMANQVIPIDEEFHVISDQAKCPDCYMRFPLDPLAPVCQIAHCKCFAVYTRTRDAL